MECEKCAALYYTYTLEKGNKKRMYVCVPRKITRDMVTVDRIFQTSRY